MRTSIILPIGLLAVGSIGTPYHGNWSEGGQHGHGSQSTCMTTEQANVVANNFRDLFAAYTNETANAVLVPTFEDYADSVLTLMASGCPGVIQTEPGLGLTLGDAAFDSAPGFESAQSGQPNITMDILNVWHNCDSVTVRWRAPQPNPGSEHPAPATQEQVTGIVVLVTKFDDCDEKQPYKIQTIFSEFNSGAWLYDLEVFKPANCSATAKRNLRRSLPRYMARGLL